MKRCYKCKKYKPISEFSKNQYKCKVCSSKMYKAWLKRNREKRLKDIKAYHDSHVEEEKAYRTANQDKLMAYKEAHRERMLEQFRESYFRRKKEGRIHYKSSYGAGRDFLFKQQTLRGIDMTQIEMLYAEADRLTEETGIQYSVDHIIPLKGKLIRGLHVPWNMQVITLVENIKKGNRIDLKYYNN